MYLCVKHAIKTPTNRIIKISFEEISSILSRSMKICATRASAQLQNILGAVAGKKNEQLIPIAATAISS